MRAESIKKYLRDFRILSRWTTFNGAFQLALAIPEDFDSEKVSEAMALLGQPADDELQCVYCNDPAATWDHLYNNVIEGRFSGYGNRIFNLVPACRTCNERKGGLPWRTFLEQTNPPNRDARFAALTKFETSNNAERFGWSQISAEFGELAVEYEQIRLSVQASLKRADEIASQLRTRIRARVGSAVTGPARKASPGGGGRKPVERGGTKGRTRYHLTVRDSVAQRLTKGDLIHRLVKAAIDIGGAHPNQLRRFFPQGSRSWVDVRGEVGRAEFLRLLAGSRTAQGRAWDPNRFFVEDDQLFRVQGRTHALSNQWGDPQWSDAVEGIIRAYPELQASYGAEGSPATGAGRRASSSSRGERCSVLLATTKPVPRRL